MRLTRYWIAYYPSYDTGLQEMLKGKASGGNQQAETYWRTGHGYLLFYVRSKLCQGQRPERGSLTGENNTQYPTRTKFPTPVLKPQTPQPPNITHKMPSRPSATHPQQPNSNKPEDLAANTLLAIHFQDLQTASSNPTHPTPSQLSTTHNLCLSYIRKLRQRLPPQYLMRFLNVLSAYKNPHTFEVTRYELSVVFELANEYELWEELLELMFPCWERRLEGVEQERLRMLQRRGMGLPV
ncbi:MAG: hypothetical protein Q9213_005991 [Squamulea squamosa]